MDRFSTFSQLRPIVTKINQFLKHTAQKMKFSIQDFFSKFDHICSFLWIWSHLLKKHLIKNFTFCAVTFLEPTSYYNLHFYSS